MWGFLILSFVFDFWFEDMLIYLGYDFWLFLLFCNFVIWNSDGFVWGRYMIYFKVMIMKDWNFKYYYGF